MFPSPYDARLKKNSRARIEILARVPDLRVAPDLRYRLNLLPRFQRPTPRTAREARFRGIRKSLGSVKPLDPWQLQNRAGAKSARRGNPLQRMVYLGEEPVDLRERRADEPLVAAQRRLRVRLVDADARIPREPLQQIAGGCPFRIACAAASACSLMASWAARDRRRASPLPSGSSWWPGRAASGRVRPRQPRERPSVSTRIVANVSSSPSIANIAPGSATRRTTEHDTSPSFHWSPASSAAHRQIARQDDAEAVDPLAAARVHLVRHGRRADLAFLEALDGQVVARHQAQASSARLLGPARELEHRRHDLEVQAARIHLPDGAQHRLEAEQRAPARAPAHRPCRRRRRAASAGRAACRPAPSRRAADTAR